jgi:hypothetical protein
MNRKLVAAIGTGLAAYAYSRYRRGRSTRLAGAGGMTQAGSRDDLVNEASFESFPASDPPAHTGTTGAHTTGQRLGIDRRR